MSKYSRWCVYYTTPDGVQIVRGWGEVNARHCYRKWCERIGKDVYRVELLGVDADGNEHVVEVCELRTDLYPDVQPEPREAFEQMALL